MMGTSLLWVVFAAWLPGAGGVLPGAAGVAPGAAGILPGAGGVLAGAATPGGLTLQTTTDARVVALLLFLGFVLAIVLSIVILVRGIQSYRRAGDPALLGMAAGILLLSGAPIVLNVTIQTVTGAAAWQVSALADLTRLLGLALILYVIYGTGR